MYGLEDDHFKACKQKSIFQDGIKWLTLLPPVRVICPNLFESSDDKDTPPKKRRTKSITIKEIN